MPLKPGQPLSIYEILGPLGAGGIGEVYRARDTRLEREVAIKILPEALADDEERLRRFEREARTLASGRLVGWRLTEQESIAIPVDGGGTPDVISDGHLVCIGRDGAHGLAVREVEAPEYNLIAVDLTDNSEPIVLGETIVYAVADLSGDSRWVIYPSERTGNPEVYLTSRLGDTKDWPVSTDGAIAAWFSENADTIYFARGELGARLQIEVWSVSLQTDPDVRLGAPEKLFELKGQVVLTDFHATERRFLGYRRKDPLLHRIVLKTGWASQR
jgi:hypothetical protein